MKKIYIVLAILIIGAISVVGWFVGTNNRFVEMKGNATKQWANVESSYQRRSDLPITACSGGRIRGASKQRPFAIRCCSSAAS